MSDLQATETDVERLVALARVLIPGTAEMPAAPEIAGYEKLLRRAVKACGYLEPELQAALNAIPENADMASARAFSVTTPETFKVASTLISAAYYMAPDVLGRLKFPIDRKHPAADDEFANEFESGILDPVIARGQRYRDPGNI